MLYAASFAPRCEGVRKRLAFLFSATVTDESYGVNTGRFEQGGWSVERATAVNLFSQSRRGPFRTWRACWWATPWASRSPSPRSR